MPVYQPPPDLPAKILELADPARNGPAKLLHKALTQALTDAGKKKLIDAVPGASLTDRAEQYALQIERAVYDTHPAASKSYSQQCKTLGFNLKSNHEELIPKLWSGELTPTVLATMTTEELASSKLKRENAELKAQAEKQAIKITDPAGLPRPARGEDMVDDSMAPRNPAPLAAPLRRPSLRDQGDQAKPAAKQGSAKPGTRAQPGQANSAGTELRVETKQPPAGTDFDIHRVLSSVKSPEASHARRPSVPVPTSAIMAEPVFDPEVDRMLEDEDDSPAYSPTEDVDPSMPRVVWRGTLSMNIVPQLPLIARRAAGMDLDGKNVWKPTPWSTILSKKLEIIGRLDQEKGNVYLCSQAKAIGADVVVVNLQPASEASRPDFYKLYDYFASRKKYGVIAENKTDNKREKGQAQVVDTYLVPVAPGGFHEQPEFLLNFEENATPVTRTEPMLYVVVVLRNEEFINEHKKAGHLNEDGTRKEPSQERHGAASLQDGVHAGSTAARSGVVAGHPSFSPATPMGTFTPAHLVQQHAPAAFALSAHANTPTPVARSNGAPPPPPPPPPTPQATATGSAAGPLQGEALGRDVLGPLFSVPSIDFLLPQCAQMTRSEWELIRGIFETKPAARTDIEALGAAIEKASIERASNMRQQENRAAAAGAPVLAPPVAPPQYPPSSGQWVTQQQFVPPPSQQQQQQPPPQPQPQFVPPIKQTPIPPPTIPHYNHSGGPSHNHSGGPPRQTPIPPPVLPPHTVQAEMRRGPQD